MLLSFVYDIDIIGIDRKTVAKTSKPFKRHAVRLEHIMKSAEIVKEYNMIDYSKQGT